MIHFLDVTKDYDNQTALRNVTFSVEKGEMAFITGPSGSGKTTALKLIYLAEKPDEGTITVAGWETDQLRESAVPFLRRNIGVVFQDFRLLARKNVFENVAMALRIRGVGVLADEPTGNLDSDTAEGVMRIFRNVNTKGTTILIATHNRELYRNSGRRVFRLDAGNLVGEETR
ncbi:MAG: ATP-binding cassette domain-containing protein [Candidatus Sulfobium sp.]